MCIISAPNLKEIHLEEGWLKVTVLNWCKKEKCEENWAIFRNLYVT